MRDRALSTNAVLGAARAWLRAREDDPQRVGVAVNKSGAGVISALVDETERLRERLTDADRLRKAFANCEEVAEALYDARERLRDRVEELERSEENDATVLRRALRIPPGGESDFYGALNLGASRIREHKTDYKPHLQERDADTLHALKERIARVLNEDPTP